jgi:hypothetical protein
LFNRKCCHDHSTWHTAYLIPINNIYTQHDSHVELSNHVGGVELSNQVGGMLKRWSRGHRVFYSVSLLHAPRIGGGGEAVYLTVCINPLNGVYKSKYSLTCVVSSARRRGDDTTSSRKGSAAAASAALSTGGRCTLGGTAFPVRGTKSSDWGSETASIALASLILQ